MFKIVITGSNLPNKDEEIRFLQDIARVVINENKSKKYLLELIKDADAILVDTTILDEEIFTTSKKLKVVVEYGIGVDNIDLVSATKNGVMVCNTPDVIIREVAEHTIGLMFALFRCIPNATIDVTRKGIWDFNLYQPKLLMGSTWGIIGLGRIGRTVAEIALNLGFKVLANDIKKPKDSVSGITLVPFDNLLQNSDIISLHVPLISDTKDLIGEGTLKLIKKDAYLINVSRGGIVNEIALAKALDEGRIKGAALDVLESEPPEVGHPLFEYPNVIITPHMAWLSEKSALALEIAAASEAKNVLQGNMPKNLVNKEVLKTKESE